MLPTTNDQTTPGEAVHATSQAPVATGPSDHRDDHVAEIRALQATPSAASEPAPAAVPASASVPVGARTETRIRQASGLVMTAAARYYGEDSKAALAAQVVVLKQMQAPPAEDASQLQRIDLPADAVVAVAMVAPGAGAEQPGNAGDAPDHADAT